MENRKVTLTFDLAEQGEPSKTGKSEIFASVPSGTFVKNGITYRYQLRVYAPIGTSTRSTPVTVS